MNNKIILFDKTQEEIVPQIEGLNITFKGKNNVVRIEKGSVFHSSRIILSNHCKVNIKKTNPYGIRNLVTELFEGSKIEIGEDFSCVSLVFHLNDEKGLSVIIGDHCLCSTGVRIRPSDGHIIYDITTGELLNKGEDIVIGNHVWMGLNSLFLKGAKVSDHSIVGANSLVNKKFDEKNVIIAGVPARIVRHGVNWDRRSPRLYDKSVEFRNNNSDYQVSVGNSSSGDNIVYKKRKFDKILSFVYVFKKENLNPKNIYRIYKARGRIRSLNLFDENYYLIRNKNIRNYHMDPLDHYIYHGWKEGRTPSKLFDGNYYLERNPDVKESKVNPLVHYVLYGMDEGRSPNNHAEIDSI
ncbi:MAG TPA: acyltransferase [Methanobacterium sp.]|jgi:acetyltransferase-like isoleucine patch superfamily enzyme|nr:acyltransferase [Methanobacterium sp.]